ncbi:hypothetical protein H0H92_013903, partial [Tricholoma furcatifolium]
EGRSLRREVTEALNLPPSASLTDFFREETVGTHPLLLEEYEHSSNGDLSELEIEQALLADQLPVKQEEEEQDYEEYEEEEPV